MTHVLADKCEVARSDALALSAGMRLRIHTACGGTFAKDGKQYACGCPCHAHDGSPFPKLEADSDPKPAAKPKRATKARKGPRKPCECGCGAQVGGRFAPGHDAKLKSMLARQVARGGMEAWAEIVLRGWDHLIKDPENRFASTRRAGAILAKEHPELLQWRIEERCSR